MANPVSSLNTTASALANQNAAAAAAAGTTSGTTSTLDTTSASGQAKTAKTGLAGDFNNFLTLLTTQLKNQDPLSPMDSTQFTSQLVQFASVEQQINANTNLEKIVGIQNATLAASIISFVGTNVEADTGTLALQDGAAKFTYNLDKQAKNVVISISDASGKPILNKGGELAPGLHTFNWDGKDGNGVKQPDGAYSVSVTPVSADGSAINAKVHTFAKITGVSMANGTTLDANGAQIPLDKILSVSESP